MEFLLLYGVIKLRDSVHGRWFESVQSMLTSSMQHIKVIRRVNQSEVLWRCESSLR